MDPEPGTDPCRPARRRRLRSAAVPLVGAIALLAAGTPAARAAAPATPPAQAGEAARPGTELVLGSTSDGAPTLRITNRGPAPCQVSATTLGTVTLARVGQGGQAIEPISVQVSAREEADRVVLARLRTLGPGAAVDLPLRIVPIGPTGRAVQTVSWSRTAGSIGRLYPIRAGEAVELTAAYALPVRPPRGPAACAPATVAGSAGNRLDRAPLGTAWLLVAGAAGVLAGAGLAAVLYRRRRARAAALVVLAVAAALPATGPARRATAETTVDPALTAAYNSCQSVLAKDPAQLMDTIDRPGVSVRILPSTYEGSMQYSLSPTDVYVLWDLDQTLFDPADLDACAGLYHEFSHAVDDIERVKDRGPCTTADGTVVRIPVTEVKATRAENELLLALGLSVQRTDYGGVPLPDGECVPPARAAPVPPPCTGGGCGSSHGDPHLTTFDGQHYRFHAVGEFVLARDRAGGFAVQTRQAPAPNSRFASLNAAVALDVAGARVQVSADQGTLRLLVDGRRRPLAAGPLPGGGRLTTAVGRTGDVLTVRWPDGSTAHLIAVGRWAVNVMLQPAAGRARRLEGLLGDFDGKVGNDLRPRGGGAPIGKAEHDTLYPAYADSWRVDAAGSLFTYPAGKGPDDYVDRAFPARGPDLRNLPAAERLCRDLGVTDPVALGDCAYDVAVTGEPDFAVAALATQAFAGELDTDGAAGTVTIDRPGGSARFGFTGRAGQQVFVRITASTLGNGCGVLQLLDPAGTQLADGCIIGDSGQIDATELPASGRYTLVVDPTGAATGKADVRISSVADQRTTVEPNGPPAVARVDRPGATARLEFAGRAGDVVVVGATSAQFSQCGLLDLRGPNGVRIADGCIVSGDGGIGARRLPVTGTYAIVVDPTGPTTGTAAIVLTTARGDRDTLAVGGPAGPAAVRRAGTAAVLTFSARAGQRVAARFTANTFPTSCGSVGLLGPDGQAVAVPRACLFDAESTVELGPLPAAGRYALVVDPTGDGTGTAQVRLTG